MWNHLPKMLKDGTKFLCLALNVKWQTKKMNKNSNYTIFEGFMKN